MYDPLIIAEMCNVLNCSNEQQHPNIYMEYHVKLCNANKIAINSNRYKVGKSLTFSLETQVTFYETINNKSYFNSSLEKICSPTTKIIY